MYVQCRTWCLKTVASEDELLITKALAGDSKSYSLLFAKYWKRVYMFLRKRVHDNHTAEELTQDVFVSAFKYLHTYKKELSGFYTWLCTIAINTASKRPYKAFNLEVEGVTSVTPETLFESNQTLSLLMNDLFKLPYKQQRAVWLKLYEGLCYTEVGNLLGVSPGYAKKLVHTAKKRLRSINDERRKLSDDGGAKALCASESV